MDDDRSTTPPVSPPVSSEDLQLPEQPVPYQPTSAQPEVGIGIAEPFEAQDQEVDMDSNHQQSRLPRPANTTAPEPSREPSRLVRINIPNQTNEPGHAAIAAPVSHPSPERPDTPSSSGSLPPFNWDDLEARFEKALVDANHNEQDLMAEFEALTKYFNIWASTASAHDNERATKRLQTRTQFVKLKEVDLASRKQNYEQVVLAFQNAMLLLSQAQN